MIKLCTAAGSESLMIKKMGAAKRMSGKVWLDDLMAATEALNEQFMRKIKCLEKAPVLLNCKINQISSASYTAVCIIELQFHFHLAAKLYHTVVVSWENALHTCSHCHRCLWMNVPSSQVHRWESSVVEWRQYATSTKSNWIVLSVAALKWGWVEAKKYSAS